MASGREKNSKRANLRLLDQEIYYLPILFPCQFWKAQDTTTEKIERNLKTYLIATKDKIRETN